MVDVVLLVATAPLPGDGLSTSNVQILLYTGSLLTTNDDFFVLHYMNPTCVFGYYQEITKY
jgi:hypothetical protein